MNKQEHEAARARANEPVTLPRYKIARLEAKLAKARAQRDGWRERCVMFEYRVGNAMRSIWREIAGKAEADNRDLRRRVEEMQATERMALHIIANESTEETR